MARTFTVPQFVDVESKVIGSLTARQFMICLAGCILIGISYKIFSFWIFVAVSVFVLVVSVTFAFIKINGRPFHFFVLNFIQTSRRANFRVWNHRKEIKEAEIEKVVKGEEKEKFARESLAPSRLSELALVVDTQGIYKGSKKKNKS